MAQELSSPSYVASLRRDYMQNGLSEADLDPDPFRQFALWFQETLVSNAITEPNAMVLSTVSPEGHPRGRFVLLKGFDTSGFVFFTNYASTKGQHLATNPYASLTFGWIELERQICIEGRVQKTSHAAVEAYFQTRPRGSRLGAWASPQSTVIPGREVLETRLAEATERHPGDVPPAAGMGGISPCAGANRILAGPDEPPTRSPALSSRRHRMGGRASRAVRRTTFRPRPGGDSSGPGKARAVATPRPSPRLPQNRPS